MANNDSQIDKPQRGRPKRAELPDVNINTGAQSINTEKASLTSWVASSLRDDSWRITRADGHAHGKNDVVKGNFLRISFIIIIKHFDLNCTYPRTALNVNPGIRVKIQSVRFISPQEKRMDVRLVIA